MGNEIDYDNCEIKINDEIAKAAEVMRCACLLMRQPTPPPIFYPHISIETAKMIVKKLKQNSR